MKDHPSLIPRINPRKHRFWFENSPKLGKTEAQRTGQRVIEVLDYNEETCRVMIRNVGGEYVRPSSLYKISTIRAGRFGRGTGFLPQLVPFVVFHPEKGTLEADPLNYDDPVHVLADEAFDAKHDDSI